MNSQDDASLNEILARVIAGDESARRELLTRGRQWVETVIASAFTHSGFAHDELFHAGYLGLLNAVYNIHLARGKEFSEYAKNLITGEIRQYIRDHAHQAYIPRFLEDLNRQLEMAEARLLRETGHLPTLSELADVVNITEEGITEIFKAREAINYVSLSAEKRATDPTPKIDLAKIKSKRPDPFPIQYRIRIASALEKLSSLQSLLAKNLFPPSNK